MVLKTTIDKNMFLSLRIMPYEFSRVRALNDKELKHGKYVLYWMQSSQRVNYNQSLNYAIEKSNKLKQPLHVAFGYLFE